MAGVVGTGCHRSVCMDCATRFRLSASAGPRRGAARFAARHSLYVLLHGCRQCIVPQAAGRHPCQPTIGTDGCMLAVDCQSGGGCGGERTFAVSDLARFYGPAGRWARCSAPDAVQRRLWRACRRRVAGDGPDTQRPSQAASHAVAGARGEGVMVAAVMGLLKIFPMT